MDAPGAIVDWTRSIKAIWGARLAELGAREQGDRDLPDAWKCAAGDAWRRQWELQAIVPLSYDPGEHLWAVVVRRGSEHPAPNLVFVHGMTPAEALRNVPLILDELMARIPLHA